MKRLLLLFGCIALAACSTPPVVQTGPNTYLVSRSSAAGAFANTSKMKAEVIGDANKFAAEKGKTAEGISLKEVRPIIGGFPSCEYQFKLTDSRTSSGKPLPSSSIHVETGE